MLTPFGKAMRQLRIDKDLRLLDVAEALGVSSAYLSAVETGRKPIPDGFAVLVGRKLKLSAAELKKLRQAADRTRKEVRVDDLPGDQRELVAAFARQLDDLSPELIEELKKKLLQSVSSEQPFRRKRRGMIVKPMSAVAIRDFSEKIRDKFIADNHVSFPIIEFLEWRLATVLKDFVLDVRDAEEMGSMEGTVVAGSNVLCLREDVYDDACRGNGRARFTAAHELGHYLMHRNVALARVRDDSTPIYYDSEWQADTFAGALMMSRRHLDQFANVAHAAELCGMSQAAAAHQLKLYGRDME